MSRGAFVRSKFDFFFLFFAISLTHCTPSLNAPSGAATQSTVSPTPSATPVPTVTVTTTPSPTATVTATPSPTVVLTPALSYGSTSISGVVGSALATVYPTLTGSTPSACSSTPALPSGLSLNSSCHITGTPTAITASGTYAITASNTGGSSSTNLTISITGPATKLAFITTPASLLVGKALGSITLAAQDAQGNTVTPASCMVSLSLSNPNGPGTLTSGSGALWELCNHGTVTFSNVYLRDWIGPGSPVTLTASATGLASAVSPSLNVLVAEQKAYLKAPNVRSSANYGKSVALSSDGNTLAVAAWAESSNQSTITNGPTASSDTSLPQAGAVYIVTRSGATWTEQAYLKPPNPRASAFYGGSVALSSDGNTLAVGANRESSNQSTITNGPSASSDTSLSGSGAVYVLTRSGSVWSEQAYLKPPNPLANASYGESIALSADGNTLAIGASGESSNQSTITNGSTASSNTSLANAGAVYIAVRSGSIWTEQAYLKPPNPQIDAYYGSSLTLSSNGNILAVGASGEKSSQSTITNGPSASSDTSLADSGAAYIVTRNGSIWTEQAYLKPINPQSGAGYGAAFALSPDGSTLAVSATWESSNQSTITNGSGASNNTSMPGSGAVYVLSMPWSNANGF